MTLDTTQYVLGALSGGLVGLTLGLFGGGGSILAVPLMVYLVGVPSAHMAIGTSALAVAANAGAGLVSHARQHHVKWRCAALFASAGIVGAWLGSTLGKAIDGKQLLFLFAILMIVVGVMMVRKRNSGGDPAAECNRSNAPKVLGFGGLTGIFSGFFGIGGGFLIVPGLMLAAGMTMTNATASSLVSVALFGAATSANYALSGLVDGPLVLLLLVGGAIGGTAGIGISRLLKTRVRTARSAFAVMILVVAAYVAWNAWGAMTV